MKFFKAIIMVLLLFFTSCATHTINEPLLYSPTVREGGKLNLECLWPLDAEGKYLQQLTVKLKDGTYHQLSVYLDMTPYSLTAIGVHDIFGRLYELKLTSENLETQVVDFNQLILRPEDILTDFLVSHLPAHKLLNLMDNLEIQEEPDGSWVLIKDKKPIRRVLRSNALSSLMWESINIENTVFEYSIIVKTKELQ